ncbi:MAG: hypothetical protein M1830_008355 [Pleopsidium flavum]|nr:MAG: hypothetical protein M1830_008355 [Pleopsidium flavum]
MLFPIILPLLFLLSDAAPVTDDQDFPHLLQKRAPGCAALYGSEIVLADCNEAYRALLRMPTATMNLHTGRLIPQLSAFSRFNTDSHYRLPQQFNVGSCTILVDMTEAAATVTSSWSLLSEGARSLIDDCVDKRNRIGGEVNLLGFNTVVLNERNLDPRIRQSKQRCINLIEMQGHMDGFTNCLLSELASSHGRPSLDAPRRRGLEQNSDPRSLP